MNAMNAINPMNLVRKVATVATATKRRLSSVGGGGGTYDQEASGDGSISVREKYKLDLKSTPNKDAQTTSALAVKSSYLLKRNEQGSWQKRLVCMVPHMFLYYFDHEDSEVPRGVIDLEHFTRVSIEEDNILKLSPAEGVPLRSFFFQAANENNSELTEWLTSIIRDRYALVKDERDAYQQLQDQFSGEMDVVARMMETSSQDKERMQIEVASSRKALDDTLLTVQTLLQTLAIPAHRLPSSESEKECLDGISASTSAPALSSEIDTDTLKGAARALEILVTSVRERAEAEKVSLTRQYDEEIATLREEICALRAKLDQSESQRIALDMQFQQEKQESYSAISSFQQQVEELTIQITEVSREREQLDSDLALSSDQKRLLIKEVKSMRRRLTLSDESQRAFAVKNQELIGEVDNLRDQLAKAAEDFEKAREREKGCMDDKDGGGIGAVDEVEEVKETGSSLPSKPESNPSELLQGRWEDKETLGQGVTESEVEDTLPWERKVENPAALIENEWLTEEQREKIRLRKEKRDREAERERERERKKEWEKEKEWERERLSRPTDITQSSPSLARADISATTSLSSSSPSYSTSSTNASSNSSFSSYISRGALAIKGVTSLKNVLIPPSSTSSPSPTSVNPLSHTPTSLPSETALPATISFNLGAEAVVSSPPQSIETPPCSPTTLQPLSTVHTSNCSTDELHNPNPNSVPTANATALGEKSVEKDHHLTCLRCSGVVAGPKYSTCRCSVPALTPEELKATKSSSMMGGFMSMFRSSGNSSNSSSTGSSTTMGNVSSTMSGALSGSSSVSSVGSQNLDVFVNSDGNSPSLSALSLTPGDNGDPNIVSPVADIPFASTDTNTLINNGPNRSVQAFESDEQPIEGEIIPPPKDPMNNTASDVTFSSSSWLDTANSIATESYQEPTSNDGPSKDSAPITAAKSSNESDTVLL